MDSVQIHLNRTEIHKSSQRAAGLDFAEMDFDVPRVAVDITELLKVSLHLLQQAHHVFHSVLHFTKFYQCTPQLSLTTPLPTHTNT